MPGGPLGRWRPWDSRTSSSASSYSISFRRSHMSAPMGGETVGPKRDPPLVTRRRSVALVMVSLERTIRVERQVVVNMMLIRLKRFGVRVPKVLWRRIIDAEARRGQSRVEWFTEDHHRVRDFVVTEIARTGEPVGVEQITATCGINKQRALAIIEELEKGMTFLFRTDGDAVDWAYPVTARRTPHRVQLDSGERFFAA